MDKQRSDPVDPLNPILRWTLITAGFLSVGLGIVGIMVPVLPTVPFLLLATVCFARSSERFYNWLIDHARLGPMVRPYLNGEGLRRKTKIKAILLVWLSILLSIFFVREHEWIQAILIIIALGVTIYLSRLPEIDPV